jgi:pyruvate,water dikinase
MEGAQGVGELCVGEVLVVPFADVGLTPLFLSASGVVMGLGGPLSHACIVAREFGLPVVVNVSEAMSRIKTGDLVTIDGDRGVVLLHRADTTER